MPHDPKPHVLIIDDAITVRMFYRDVLEASGFAVDEAFNGFEALERMAEASYDLVVVDVNMPRMDGYTFLGRLRSQAEGAGIPAIMISTEAEDIDRQRAFAAGANLYLVKPVTPDCLAHHARLMAGQPMVGGRA
ncbi:response regulator [Blastochloris tepida]|jgi:two-component system chemotaxis response regulator CheY|uniref:Response regulator n=1 Tax=Blastochloris tepida TaxID=2233851 RepID=A0A348FXC2_9HYPH|nr:response regulator [Blastochloris tepida]BBF91955.1 response regulator [Blastochloris tepida]